MVEAISGWLKLLRGVMFVCFLVDSDFLFLMVGRGKADIFPET